MNSEIGVAMMTTSAIVKRILIIKMMVPTIVMTPVKSCVNPKSSPSVNESASVTIRLAISPWLSLSMTPTGTLRSLSKAFCLKVFATE